MRMRVQKFIVGKLYGFCEDSDGHVVYFHLETFRSHPDEKSFTFPIPGEPVDVELFDQETLDQNSRVKPRARKVWRKTKPEILTGRVTQYDRQRGFGFIQCDDQKYFLHKTEVLDGKMPLLDDRVSFCAGEVKGRSRACVVRILR